MRVQLYPGMRIGSYEIVSPPKEGIASVYKARNVDTNDNIALKVRSQRSFPEEIEYLRREEAVGRILGKHPNIVSVHGLEREADLFYLVMDFVDGQSVDDIVNEENALPPKRALAIARDVAAGLDYAHGKGVIHRDVKSANILFDGNKGLLFDFGLAHAPGFHPTGVVGSTGFIPPEYSHNIRPDVRGDVYSLGVTILHMLAGVDFVRSPEFGSIHNKRDYKAIVSKTRAVPGVLRAVLLKAVDAEPDNRYKSAGEFADALERVLKKI